MKGKILRIVKRRFVFEIQNCQWKAFPIFLHVIDGMRMKRNSFSIHVLLVHVKLFTEIQSHFSFPDFRETKFLQYPRKDGHMHVLQNRQYKSNKENHKIILSESAAKQHTKT